MKWIKAEGKIVLSGILMMLMMGSVYSYSAFRLPIERYYDIPISLSGIPYMLSLFFYAMFMGVSGHLLEKAKPFTIMILGIVLITIGWIVAFFAKNFVLLSLGYGVFIGTGIGLIYGIPLMTITHRFPKRKGLYVGLVLLGFGLSPLITAPLIRILIDVVGLHSAFLWMGILSFVVLSLLSLFYRYAHSRNRLILQDKWWTTYKNRKFLLLYMLFFIGTFIGLSVIGFSSNYAYEILSFSLGEPALFVSLFAICNGLGRVLFGYLADKIYFIKLMNISFITLIISSVFILLIGQSTVVFVISFSLIWMNLGGWLAIAPLATSQLFGAERYARNYGFLFSAYGLSAIAGVCVSGLLMETSGSFQSSFLVFLGLSMLGILLTRLLTLSIAKQDL